MEDIESYLLETKKYIDIKLEHYSGINESLLKDLQDSINYSLFAGGKRIRPLFCLMVGEIFSVSKERLISIACSLEMIHTAALIMDDLPHMDNATIRRGRPVNHLVYGQDVAVLASVGLLTKAYEIILSDPLLPEDKKTIVVKKLVNTVGINGMVGGQFVDLKFSNKSIDHSTLEYIHIHKTTSLFTAAGTCAAIVGNASDEQLSAIEVYAENLGFAFQILDDILDSVGQENEVQKTLRNDQSNFVILYGVEQSNKLVEKHTNNAIKAIRTFDGKNDKLKSLAHLLLLRKS